VVGVRSALIEPYSTAGVAKIDGSSAVVPIIMVCEILLRLESDAAAI